MYLITFFFFSWSWFGNLGASNSGPVLTEATCRDFATAVGEQQKQGKQNVVSYSLFLPEKDVRTDSAPDPEAFKEKYFQPIGDIAGSIQVLLGRGIFQIVMLLDHIFIA